MKFSDLTKELQPWDVIHVQGERRSEYPGAKTEGDPIDRIFTVEKVYDDTIILEPPKGRTVYALKQSGRDIILMSHRLIGIIFQVTVIE